MKYNLEKILPHKKPMILIDELLEVNLTLKKAVCSVKITENKMFFDKNINGISPLLGIEFMAQAIGCLAYFQNGEKPPKIGFLLGTRNYSANFSKFEINTTYKIEVQEKFSDGELVSFDCFIYNGVETFGCACVNVYQPKDIKLLGIN